MDDAGLLDVGKCKLESWVEGEAAAARTRLHMGAGCRAGAVELGSMLTGKSRLTLIEPTVFRDSLNRLIQ